MKKDRILLGYRNQIDLLDRKIISLIQKRTKVVEKVGEYKKEQNLPITNPKRESEIYEKIEKNNYGPLSSKALIHIYQNIIYQCRMHEAFHSNSKSMKKFKKVSIVGVGLMGGSLALALKDKYKVIGYDQKPNKNLKIPFESKPNQIFQSDCIILCMSIDENLKFIEKYHSHFKKNTVVIDIASTKFEFQNKVKVLKNKYPILNQIQFVFGHPIAGKSVKGSQNAEKEIFYDRPFIITQKPKHHQNEIKALIDDLCMKLVIIDAQMHDCTLAYTSHLSQIISTTLANVVSKQFKKPIHGPAFESMTRLAQSDASVWYPIIKSNEKFVQKAIIEMIAELKKMRAATSNKRTFEKSFKTAQKFMKR